jgi:hypothetical protein
MDMTSRHLETGLESIYSRGQAQGDRLGGLLGLTSMGLLFTGVAIANPNTPSSDLNPNQSSAVIARRLVEHRDDILFGMSLHVVGICLFIAFVAWVAARMGTRKSGRWLRYAALGGGFAAAIMMLGIAVIEIGAAQIAWYGDDASIARTFAALLWDSLLVFGPPLGLFAVAVSVHELGQGRLRAVLGCIGLAAGSLALIPWSVWIGAMAVMVWIVTLSIVSLVSPTVRATSIRQAGVPAPRGA